MEALRENDKKWESILDNLKDLTLPGSDDWCIDQGTYRNCVPDQLETYDGVPYECLKRSGGGAYGEVMIYGRTYHGETQKIAIKVMKKSVDSECWNNPPDEKEWCPYVVVQKCITPNGFKCHLRPLKVEVLALELMEETLEEFQQHNLPDVVSKELLRKIYTALLCIWNNGGVYSDMKPQNVMVNQKSPLKNSFLKLVDLGSICTQIGTHDAVCTYPPPYTWATFNNGRAQNAASVACTEKTLIWSFAIATLSFYAPEAFHYLYFTGIVVMEDDLHYINTWMSAIRSRLRKVKDEEGMLDNVSKCFAPFEADWKNDWRVSKTPAPFKFNRMLEKPHFFTLVREKPARKALPLVRKKPAPFSLAAGRETPARKPLPLVRKKPAPFSLAAGRETPARKVIDFSKVDEGYGTPNVVEDFDDVDDSVEEKWSSENKEPEDLFSEVEDISWDKHWTEAPVGLNVSKDSDWGSVKRSGGAWQRGGRRHRSERPLCDKCGHELSCKYCSTQPAK